MKTAVAVPVAPQSSVKGVTSTVHTTSLQSSVAIAPPLSAIHASKSASFLSPSHSTIKSEEVVVISGEVLSSIVNVAVV